MLSEEKFQSLYGDGWVLADGRCVSLDCCNTPLEGVDLDEWKTRKKCSKLLEKDSVYSKETGTGKIPDVRGKFLRAKNNGITSDDCSGDPTLIKNLLDCFDSDGDRELGSYQSNSIGNHLHDMKVSATANSTNNGHLAYSTNKIIESTRGQYMKNTGFGIGLETRPKNIAVNVFIKIN